MIIVIRAQALVSLFSEPKLIKERYAEATAVSLQQARARRPECPFPYTDDRRLSSASSL